MYETSSDILNVIKLNLTGKEVRVGKFRLVNLLFRAVCKN